MKDLVDYLKQFVTDNRIEVFENVLQNRTRYLTVVLEDIYQSQNASAVLRTSDCFGIQDIHIIENRNQYNINPDVALGSSKWLNLIKYNKEENNSLEAIQALRNKGYRIVATTPHINDVDLEDFDLEKGKVALFFGTELKGLSDKVIDNADEFVKIPMFGFTESFNISVSAAIILHSLRRKLNQSDIQWQLKEKEHDELMFNWLKKTIKSSEMLIEEYLSKKKNL